jgi:hypothetical protein
MKHLFAFALLLSTSCGLLKDPTVVECAPTAPELTLEALYALRGDDYETALKAFLAKQGREIGYCAVDSLRRQMGLAAEQNAALIERAAEFLDAAGVSCQRAQQ